MRAGLCIAFLALGCSASASVEPSGGSTDATANTTTSSPTPSTTTTSGEAERSTGFNESGSFLSRPDVPTNTEFPCSTLHRDCPPGQKCTWWGNDDRGSWNATRCVPIVEDPDAMGEQCEVVGAFNVGVCVQETG